MQKLLPVLLFILSFFTLQAHARTIDLDTLSRQAHDAGRHLLVWLHKNGCAYCGAMQKYTLESPDTASHIERSFTFLSLNVDDGDTVRYGKFEGDAKSFARSIGYDFYPSTLFFDGNAKIVFAAAGYIKKDPFLTILRFVSGEAYKTMDYDRFRRLEREQR